MRLVEGKSCLCLLLFFQQDAPEGLRVAIQVAVKKLIQLGLVMPRLFIVSEESGLGVRG